MKAKVISKLRKKIQSDKYIEDRIYCLAKECEWWDLFYRFKCNSFFVGSELAYVNTIKYNKYGKRIIRKFNWYKKKMEDEG